MMQGSDIVILSFLFLDELFTQNLDKKEMGIQCYSPSLFLVILLDAKFSSDKLKNKSQLWP